MKVSNKRVFLLFFCSGVGAVLFTLLFAGIITMADWNLENLPTVFIGFLSATLGMFLEYDHIKAEHQIEIRDIKKRVSTHLPAFENSTQSK